MKTIVVFSAVLISCLAQTPFYAYGFPDIWSSTAAPVTASILGNRFGEGEADTTTTDKLPLEAHGDAGLVQRLSKLPIDQQPFWLINWKALEEHKKNPQSGNPFIDITSNSNLLR